MRVLLDTHCWLWMLTAPERLSAVTRKMLESPDHELYLSAASSWEIAIKYTLGKLPLPADPVEYVPARMVASGVIGLPVEHRHALMVTRLPSHHRDPFDRILIAQSMVEAIPLVTADPLLAQYDIETIDA